MIQFILEIKVNKSDVTDRTSNISDRNMHEVQKFCYLSPKQRNEMLKKSLKAQNAEAVAVTCI